MYDTFPVSAQQLQIKISTFSPPLCEQSHQGDFSARLGVWNYCKVTGFIFGIVHLTTLY